MRYTIVYEQAPSNYAAIVPALPVVVVTGRTLDELEQRAREAISLHLHGAIDQATTIQVELVSDYDGPMTTLDGETVPAEPIHPARAG